MFPPDSFHFSASLVHRSVSSIKLRLFPIFTPSLMILWFRRMALSVLAKEVLASLPTALFVALRPLFLIRQSQYGFLLKPVQFCRLFASIGSTNMSTTSLLSNCFSVLATPFSPPSWVVWRELSFFFFVFYYQTIINP